MLSAATTTFLAAAAPSAAVEAPAVAASIRRATAVTAVQQCMQFTGFSEPRLWNKLQRPPFIERARARESARKTNETCPGL
eukprot:5066067-Pleurochrysis_carterae.AAC.2